MNNKERRRLDKFEREMVFMTENAALYVKDSPGDKIAKRYAVEIPAAKQFAATQTGGADQKAQHIGNKTDDLNELKELMQMLDRAADAISDDAPGIENLFGLPRNRSEQSILAHARAQHAAADQYEAQLKEYDSPSDFRAEMLTLIESVEAANNQADASGETRSGSTSGLKAVLDRLAALSKKLNAVNLNKFRSAPAKMGAWLTASHLAHDPNTSRAAKTKLPPA